MDLVAKRKWFFLFSLIVILPGVISLMIPPRLHLGIDFTGGSTLTIRFQQRVTEESLEREMARLGHPDAQVQERNPGASGVVTSAFFIRTRELREAASDPEGVAERDRIEQALDNLAPVESLEVERVAGVVAQSAVRNAFIAVVAASVAILLYISYAFRRVPRPFRWGTAAIIALVHDVLVVLGIFSILGKVMNMEVNAMFITGVLTVIGYSVHDTIVVFDRIRENLARSPTERLEVTVNHAILETMGRSLNTTFTLLFTLLALLLLGGETIRNFLVVMLVGLLSGTYSSIAIAAQVLVVWERGEALAFLRRLLGRPVSV